MIREVGNIELCELLDMEPKAQCKVCLSYWDLGIVYCTCGHFLRNGTEENNKFVQYTMSFGFFAERIKLLTLLKIALKCMSMRVILDLLNQILNADAM